MRIQIRRTQPSPSRYDFNPGSVVACDTETTGLRVWQWDVPFAVSLCNHDGDTWYCEWPVDPSTREVCPVPEDVAFLRWMLENDAITKVFHNAKFDIRMLRKVGIDTLGEVHDTMYMARVCRNNELNYKLKPLALKYCGYPVDDEKDLQDVVTACRRRGKQLGYKIAEGTDAVKQDYWLPKHFDLKSEVCKKYAVGDAFRTMLLFRLYSELMADDESYRHTYDMERELMPVVMAMEERGMAISLDRNSIELEAAKLREEAAYEKLIERLLTAYDEDEDGLEGIYDVFDVPSAKLVSGKGRRSSRTIQFPMREDDPEVCLRYYFNPGSNEQIMRILYDDEGMTYASGKEGIRGVFGLKPILRTPKEKTPGTDWKALRGYVDHPFVQDLLDYRVASKAVSTYFENYASKATPDSLYNNGYCIHANINQCGTGTGRSSSSDPNLQNVADPSKSNKGTAPIQARCPFGPRPGYSWYCFDYAQMELRIIADMGNIRPLYDAIIEGRDPYTEGTNRAWGGWGNPAAIEAAVYALELLSSRPASPAIEDVWERFGWQAGASMEVANKVAEAWLSEFDYDIVAAEKSIGKSMSRTRMKQVMLAKNYGSGVNGVQWLLFVSAAKAKAYLDSIDKALPELKAYTKRIVTQVQDYGYVYTAFERRLFVDADRAYAGVDYVIQGTAADLMKRANIECYYFLQHTTLDAHCIIPIHDELVIEVNKNIQGEPLLKLLRGIKYRMEDTEGRLRLPMLVEAKVCPVSWDKKEKLEFEL